MNNRFLKQRIDRTREHVKEVEDQLHQVESRLLSLLSRVEPDRKSVADLERRKDELKWERTRARTLLEHLESQRPAVEKDEAQHRLEEIAKEIKALADDAPSAAREMLESAERFLQAIRKAFRAPDKAAALRAEAEYLSEAHALPIPYLPPVPGPDPHAVVSILEEAKVLVETRRYEDAQKAWERWRKLG